MRKSLLARPVAVILGVMALAGCQAAVPTVTPPAEAPSASDTFRTAHGMNVLLSDPPAVVPVETAAKPGFRVAATDSLVGTEITLSNAIGEQDFADVAYNANTKQYLAVWHDFRNDPTGSNSDIYGQLLSADGVPVGSAFAVYSGPGMQAGPRVAYNSVDKEFMVAWTDNRDAQADVYVQRVSGLGAPVLTPQQVASGTSAQLLSGMAYHAPRNEFMLAWSDDRLGFSALYAGRCSAAAAKLGGDLAVSLTPGALAGGSVGVNTTTSEYVITWADGRTSAPGIYSRRVSGTGAFSGTASVVATGAGNYYAPRLAYNPNVTGFMTVYEHRTAAGDSDVYAQRLDGNGVATGAAVKITTATGLQMLPAVAHNADDGSYLVTWADGRTSADELDLYAITYKSDGTVKETEFPVCTVAGLQAGSAIAFDSTKKHFVVVWSDSRNYGTQSYNIYAQRIRGVPKTATEAVNDLLAAAPPILADAGITGGSAVTKLNVAFAKIAEGNYAVAIIQLNLFIAQITALQLTGEVSASEATLMITLANQAILNLNAGNI